MDYEVWRTDQHLGSWYFKGSWSRRSGALYHVILASLSRYEQKIGSNVTDALIEDTRVEVLKFQMPSFKTYAKINCRMKV